MWCFPKVDGTYVAAMDDVLDLYNEAPDPNHPVFCLDESPVQLIGETRAPVPARPGQRRRFDCEYRRNGTTNLFVFLDAHQGWRTVKVTERCTATDFAACMRDLSDILFPEADRIRVVLDNLSTHTPATLCTLHRSAGRGSTAHPAPDRVSLHTEARKKNKVAIEVGVLQRQCLIRIPDRGTLEAKVAKREKQRNESQARINWMFTTDMAREKLAKPYLKPDAAKPSIKESKSL